MSVYSFNAAKSISDMVGTDICGTIKLGRRKTMVANVYIALVFSDCTMMNKTTQQSIQSGSLWEDKLLVLESTHSMILLMIYVNIGIYNTVTSSKSKSLHHRHAPNCVVMCRLSNTIYSLIYFQLRIFQFASNFDTMNFVVPKPTQHGDENLHRIIWCKEIKK